VVDAQCMVDLVSSKLDLIVSRSYYRVESRSAALDQLRPSIHIEINLRECIRSLGKVELVARAASGLAWK